MDFCKIIIVVCFVLIKGINGLTITSFSISPPNIPVILGPSNVKLTCSYTPDTGDFVYIIAIQANISNTFVSIASFYPPGGRGDPIFPTGGNYLKNRVNLANPTSSSTQAIMTFNEIKCEDEKQYKCYINFDSGGTNQNREITTHIVVKGNPAMPDTIPIMSPQQVLQEGQNVSFTCTGNVGKPAGSFRWTKYRGPVATDYTGVTTTAVEMPGTCTSNGTSVFTTTLDAADNNAVIRCTVDQELATDTMYRETQLESLVVYYKVRNIQLTKNPNKPSYAEGAGKITLTCAADGNPLPTYKWYNQSDMNTVLVNGSTLVIGDLVKNAGSYACVAFNNYNGKYFNQTAVQQIKIEHTTTPAPTTTTSTTTPDPNVTKSPQDTSTGLTAGNTSLIGVVVFLSVLQLTEVLVLFLLYKKGIIIFKVKKDKMYEDVKNESTDRHVYSTMGAANERHTESGRQDGHVYLTVN